MNKRAEVFWTIFCLFAHLSSLSESFLHRPSAPDRINNMCRTSMGSSSLVSPLEQEGRHVPRQSLSSFLATVAFIPVWAVTVLPLSVVYQAGKAAFKPLLPEKAETTKPMDSGYVVDPATITPRPERKYDIVVLGATGFTGGLAVRHLAKTYGVGKAVKWAVAGRSKEKLEKVKKELAEQLEMDELLSIDTIVVDTSIASTLPKLVEQTRVVATTAGPYTLYGSSVVEFCAKFGTHYVDITGEVDWVKAMLLKWQETAQQTGAKLISFCGHDSIPWDLSLMKLEELLRKECQDEIKTVSFWDEAVGEAPGGTLATAFTIVDGTAIKAPRCEFDPFLRLPDGSKSSHVSTAALPASIARSDSPWEVPSSRGWTAPFIMAAVNSQVVRWSHALRQTGNASLTYKEYFRCTDFKTAFVSHVGMIMLGSMMFNPVTASLLKRYVLPKPGEGPSLEAMENKHYLLVSAEAIGSKGNRSESMMYFPKDPGCMETARMLVESGLCLALEENKLPRKNAGGFWTPATGLGDVLMERLIETGTMFTSRVVPKQNARSKL